MSQAVSAQPANLIWLPRLLRIWALVTLVTAVQMLTHQSDDPVVFGRYSALVAALVVGLFFMAFVLWMLGRWLQSSAGRRESIEFQLVAWRQQRWFTPLLLIIADGLLIAMWVFFLGNHLPTYGFLRAFLGLTIVVGTLALLFGGYSAPVPKKVGYLPWLGIGILLAVAILTTPFYPNLMKTDEAFVFSMAQHVVENGQSNPIIYTQGFPPNYYGGIWIEMMAGWLKVFGITLISARLYTLTLAALSLVFIGLAAVRLYDKWTAWYALLIGAYAFISLNHIRFDIHAAFWLSLGLFIYSRVQITGRWWAYGLVGFTIGLSVDSNPLAYCFSLGLLTFFAWEYIRVIRRERRWFWSPFYWVLFGTLSAIGVYLLLHRGASFAGEKTSGQLLATYLDFLRDKFASSHYLGQTQQYLNAFLTSQPILFSLMVIGIIVGLWKQTQSDRFLLVMYFVWMAVIIFASFYFPVFYLVIGLPIFIILAARALSEGIPLLLGTALGQVTQAATILLLVWLGAALAYDLGSSSSQSVEDVVETGRQIAQIIPTDAVIVAAEPYYFGMLDHSHFIGGAIESTVISNRGLSADEVWSTISPDALVFSEKWSTEPERSPALIAYMRDQDFSMLACYETRSFGRIELWTKIVPSGITPNNQCSQVCNPRTGC
jgi:hypothetical protein